MISQQQTESSSFAKEHKFKLLFFYLHNPQSNALLAYCIKHALDKNDVAGVLKLLKNLLTEDESVIASIYGEFVLRLIKSLKL